MATLIEKAVREERLLGLADIPKGYMAVFMEVSFTRLVSLAPLIKLLLLSQVVEEAKRTGGIPAEVNSLLTQNPAVLKAYLQTFRKPLSSDWI